MIRTFFFLLFFACRKGAPIIANAHSSKNTNTAAFVQYNTPQRCPQQPKQQQQQQPPQDSSWVAKLPTPRWKNRISHSSSTLSSSSDDAFQEPNDGEEGSEWIERQGYLRFSGVGRLYDASSSPSPLDPSHDTDGSNTAPLNDNDDSNSSSNSREPHYEIIDRLAGSTVAVIGLGGVGSWAAEALCRSGIGSIVLLDMDDICVSNTNRQLHAMTSTVGRLKTEEMKRRLLDINPRCSVTTICDFVTSENVDDLLDHTLLPLNTTVIIDAIDNKNEKTALIAASANRSIPIVTCGGAAGRIDPTRIVCDDITKAQEDRLLFWTRKALRQKHGYPKGVGKGVTNTHRVKKWNISSVYSTEVQRSVVNVDASSLRRCDGALGTACHVTGTYGFVAAARVVEMIANDDLLIPVPPRTV